jgi:hypothetical protein
MLLLSNALDPLSHELKPERFPQADNSLEEREIRRAAIDLGGEAAVDLHDVDRESLQIGERRVARPEVVQRELDTPVLQHDELLLRALAARNEHALRQLEREEVWRQVSALQSILDVLDELRVLELPGGDVDGDLEITAEQLAQARGVEAGLEQDPAPDLHDQP